MGRPCISRSCYLDHIHVKRGHPGPPSRARHGSPQVRPAPARDPPVTPSLRTQRRAAAPGVFWWREESDGNPGSARTAGRPAASENCRAIESARQERFRTTPHGRQAVRGSWFWGRRPSEDPLDGAGTRRSCRSPNLTAVDRARRSGVGLEPGPPGHRGRPASTAVFADDRPRRPNAGSRGLPREWVLGRVAAFLLQR